MILKTLNIDDFRNRKDIRSYVINEFLKEDAGDLNVKTQYQYNVETFNSDYSRIFLSRPTNKWQFDFFIKYANDIDDLKSIKIKYNLKRRPQVIPYACIIDDLKDKKQENLTEWKNVYEEIVKLYNCEEHINYEFSFNSGFSIELIMKLLKWSFVLEDILYWNKSGRALLMGEIERLNNE